ncbi:MAG: creatininase family protein [Anaerolineae bacterium]|nr:creatininase family protein [Anaerolineae bacterium]
MQWEQLTATDFERAVRETGVCLIAMGVVEKHSEHLPLGTDFLNGHKICCLATENEPAVVFPPFYFGQIYEARCFPGTITIAPKLLVELVQSVFDEIGRNGFQKIIVYNAHGGNSHFLAWLAQCTLWEEKPYSVYIPTRHIMPGKEQDWNAILETPLHGHACECETSVSLANHPHLVKMARVPAEPANPLNRMEALPPTFAGIGWYSNYPDHYAGDARVATKEKGEKLRQLQIDFLAAYIAAVKADQVLPGLEKEFFGRERGLR